MRFVLAVLLLAGCGPDATMATPRAVGPVSKSKNLHIQEQRQSALNADAFDAIARLYPAALWTLDPNLCSTAYTIGTTNDWRFTKVKNLVVDTGISSYQTYLYDDGMTPRDITAKVGTWEVAYDDAGDLHLVLVEGSVAVVSGTTNGAGTMEEWTASIGRTIVLDRKKVYAFGVSFTASGAGVSAYGLGAGGGVNRGFGDSLAVALTHMPYASPTSLRWDGSANGTNFYTGSNTPVVVAYPVRPSGAAPRNWY